MWVYQRDLCNLMRKNKNLIITYFEAFGGLSLNSSKLGVEHWHQNFWQKNPDDIFQVKLIELPVVFYQSSLVLQSYLQKNSGDVLLMFGQAERRSKISLELIAKNIIDPRFADNAGNSPQGLIETMAPATLKTSCPFESLIPNLPGDFFELSTNAGEYVCNELYFRQLWLNKKMPVGFVHLPLVDRQSDTAMPTEFIAEKIDLLVRSLILNCLGDSHT